MNVEIRQKLAFLDSRTVERVVVMGDIHGDLRSFENGVDRWGERGVLILLGDYADRGPDGVEVIEGVLEITGAYPDQVVALRGNHEDYSPAGRPLFSPCTLMEEAARKRGSWESFFPTVEELVRRLHLTALLRGHSLFVHGGLCESIDSMEALEDPGPACTRDLLWSDPGSEPGAGFNVRGAGVVFGPDVTARVLSSIGAGSLIRGHQPRKAMAGPAVEQDGRVVTVSSTRVYGGAPFLLDLDTGDYPSTEEGFRERTVFL